MTNEAYKISHNSSGKKIISKYKGTGYAIIFINQKGSGQGMWAKGKLS